jgi:hypothetical protein
MIPDRRDVDSWVIASNALDRTRTCDPGIRNPKSRFNLTLPSLTWPYSPREKAFLALLGLTVFYIKKEVWCRGKTKTR